MQSQATKNAPPAPPPKNTMSGPAVEPGSSRGSADRVSSTTPPTRPSSRQFAGGGFVSGATSTPPRTSSRRGRGRSPTSRDDGGGTRDACVAGRGGGRKQRLRGGSPRGETASGDEEHNGAAAPFPAFDELSRWKVTRSSVPRMVRLAGEVRRRTWQAIHCCRGVQSRQDQNVPVLTCARNRAVLFKVECHGGLSLSTR